MVSKSWKHAKNHKKHKNITFSSKIHKKASIILRNPLCFENDQKIVKKLRKN